MSAFEYKQHAESFGDEAFIDAVLSVTTGSACSQAQQRISESWESPGSTDLLLNEHLDNCPDCQELAATLPRVMKLIQTVPLAVPDDHFVDAVLTQTSYAPDEPILLIFRRIITWIDATLLSRPRIALEFAYIITLVLALTLHWTDIPISHARIPITASHQAVVSLSEHIDESLTEFTGQIHETIDTQSHQFSTTQESLTRRGRAVMDATQTSLKNGAQTIWTTIFRWGTNFLGWVITDTEDSHGNQSSHSTDTRS